MINVCCRTFASFLNKCFPLNLVHILLLGVGKNAWLTIHKSKLNEFVKHSGILLCMLHLTIGKWNMYKIICMTALNLALLFS